MKRFLRSFNGKDAQRPPTPWGITDFPPKSHNQSLRKSPDADGPFEERWRHDTSLVDDPFATPLDPEDEGGR